MKFDVCFTREVTESVIYTVEAADSDAAREKAREKLDALQLVGDVKWETGDGGFEEISCCYVEPADE